MLRSAVAGIVAVAEVLATLDRFSGCQLIGDGAVRHVQVDLIGLLAGIAQDDVVGAALVAVGAAIARGNHRAVPGCQERKVPGIGEVVGVLAVLGRTGWVA